MIDKSGNIRWSMRITIINSFDKINNSRLTEKIIFNIWEKLWWKSLLEYCEDKNLF